MSELEYIRSVCEELSEPSREAIARARGALQAEIAASGGGRRARQRRVRITAFASAAAVLALAAAAFLFAISQASFGVRVAQAASGAVTPAHNEVVHSESHTTTRFTDRTGTTTIEQADDIWWTTTPPVWIDRSNDRASGTYAYLLSSCGSISYDSTTGLFTVSPSTGHITVTDPVAEVVSALRSGHVHYRGKLIYHGIPAAKLVVTQYGSTTTYIVRRDSGYPLRTIDRRVTSYSTRTAVTTYSLFQHLPRTAQNEHQLELAKHANAFVVRTAPATRTPACRNFGSLATLTGRRNAR